MTKLEFERKIKEFKLQKISYENEAQNKFGKSKDLYFDKRNSDLYGCFFEQGSKEYVVFFVDIERGVAKEIGTYKTEAEAYEDLFLRIQNWEK